MTPDLVTAQLSSLSQDVRQLRIRLDGLTARMQALEDAENYRQQDEDVERALGHAPVQVGVQVPVQVSEQAQTLVDRVAFAITKGSDGPINWRGEAKDCILEVARWLQESFPGLSSGWVHYLKQEAER